MLGPPALSLCIAASAWLAWALVAQRIMRFSMRGDVVSALALIAARLYARVVHRLRVMGREHIPTGRAPGPLLVVVNHTSGVDPLLVQAACPFEVRWVMGEDMRARSLDPFWLWARIIFVDRVADRGIGVREAIAHLRSGGVLGLFPEGRIEDPPRAILPFQPGLSLIAARTRAPILPFIVDGAPQCDSAWGSLLRTSESRIRVLPVITPDALGDPRTAPSTLRRVYLEATGWPANDAPPAGSAEGSQA